MKEKITHAEIIGILEKIYRDYNMFENESVNSTQNITASAFSMVALAFELADNADDYDYVLRRYMNGLKGGN